MVYVLAWISGLPKYTIHFSTDTNTDTHVACSDETYLTYIYIAPTPTDTHVANTVDFELWTQGFLCMFRVI